MFEARYALADIKSPVAEPVQSADEIVKIVREVMPSYPYVQAVGLFGSFARGEQTAESDVNLAFSFDEDVDRPLLKWDALGCGDFAYELVKKLGRDLGPLTNRCDMGRHVPARIRDEFRLIYKRPKGVLSQADVYFKGAKGEARFCEPVLNEYAEVNVALVIHAARMAAQLLISAIYRAGGEPDPKADMPVTLALAESMGLLTHDDEVARAVAELDEGAEAYEDCRRMEPDDVLRSVLLANRVACALHDAGQRAVWINIGIGPAFKRMRELGFIPDSIARGTRVRFTACGRRLPGWVFSADSCHDRLGYSKGDWYQYVIIDDEGTSWKDVPARRVALIEEAE